MDIDKLVIEDCVAYSQCGNFIAYDEDGDVVDITGGTAWGMLDGPDGPVHICPGHQNKQTVDYIHSRSDQPPLYVSEETMNIVKCAAYDQCHNARTFNEEGDVVAAACGNGWGMLDAPDGRGGYFHLCPGHLNKPTVDYMYARSDEPPIYIP